MFELSFEPSSTDKKLSECNCSCTCPCDKSEDSYYLSHGNSSNDKSSNWANN